MISNNDIQNAFSQNLRDLLDIRGMSQAELARKIEVSPQAVTDWCRGIKFPRNARLEQIAKIFNIDAKDLIDIATVRSFAVTRERAELNAILDKLSDEQISKLLMMTKMMFEETLK